MFVREASLNGVTRTWILLKGEDTTVTLARGISFSSWLNKKYSASIEDGLKSGCLGQPRGLRSETINAKGQQLRLL